jgi:histidinol phosphatase-like enzyme
MRRVAVLDRDGTINEAFVIGDKACDVELGRRAGSTTFLVRTGRGAETAGAADLPADYVVEDLPEAARVIEGLLAVQGGRRAVGRRSARHGA